MPTLTRAARARLEKTERALASLDQVVKATSAAHAGIYTALVQDVASPDEAYALLLILDARLKDAAAEVRAAVGRSDAFAMGGLQ